MKNLEIPTPKEGLQNPYSFVTSGQLKFLLLECKRSEKQLKYVQSLFIEISNNRKIPLEFDYPDCFRFLLKWEANWILGRVHRPKAKKLKLSSRPTSKPKVYTSYQEYISSPEWKEKSRLAKLRAGNRCQICNRPSTIVTLHTHHRTYERLGNERDSDLTVLCADCHTLFETHSLNRPTNQR